MGYVHIYCGDGKGKTTAALGLALRAAGRGIPSVICRFLKNEDSGEIRSLSRIPEIEVIPGDRSYGFSWQMTPEEKAEAARYYTSQFEKACGRAKELALSRGEELVLLVFDEAAAAVNGGFLPLGDLTDFLDSRPENLEVVLTGRNPDPGLISRADYVTEMKKEKHLFDRGIAARKGIEY